MTLRVAIIGGGIGGLAAARFLARAGIEAMVYEQADRLVEAGAGIVVAPNMVRPLREAGLGAALAEASVRLEAAWEFRRWSDGSVLSVQPMGDECERLYGAPCYVAHRADLLAVLASAVPHEQLRLDHRCVEIRQDEREVELSFASRTGQAVRTTADAVIGADGIHSRIRNCVVSGLEPRFSGLCAYRCLVPSEQAPGLARRPVQTLWLGPGHHVVHYPISGGRLINVVAFAPAGDWRTESWTADGEVADLLAELPGWDARVLQLIASATTTKRWAIYDRDPLARWTDGRIGLLGDAAHAMLPFFGQGAAQAIEDAAVLARCLGEATATSVGTALERYEQIRRPRTSQVQIMSRGREVLNHLPDGPAQRERDAALATGQPLRQTAWLYGHDLAAELEGR